MPSGDRRDASRPAGRLEQLVGAEAVVSPASIAIHDLRPALEVRPADEAQLSDVLAFCNREGLAACTAGGATKLGWGGRPERCDLLIRTGGLSGITRIDADDLSLCAAAGTTIAEARARAEAAGRIFPVDPRRPGEATIGGVGATSDQGARGAGYGAVRDVVLGLRAMLPDGTPVKFGGRTMKNVAGYDMTKLFLGSFGVLGVITEITFRLLPRPEAETLMIVPLTSLAQGRDIVAGILDSHLQPLVLEVASAAEAGSVMAAVGGDPLDAGGLLLMVGFSGPRAAVRRSVSEVDSWAGVRRGPILEDAAAERLFAVLSEHDPGGQSLGVAVTVRASVPVGEVWGVAEAAEDLARRSQLELAYRIHAARGVVMLGIGPGEVADPDRLGASVADLRRRVERSGGRLAVTGGLASLPPGFSPWGDPRPSVEIMRRIKERFDPERMLNPGRFVGGI